MLKTCSNNEQVFPWSTRGGGCEGSGEAWAWGAGALTLQAYSVPLPLMSMGFQSIVYEKDATTKTQTRSSSYSDWSNLDPNFLRKHQRSVADWDKGGHVQDPFWIHLDLFGMPYHYWYKEISKHKKVNDNWNKWIKDFRRPFFTIWESSESIFIANCAFFLKWPVISSI